MIIAIIDNKAFNTFKSKYYKELDDDSIDLSNFNESLIKYDENITDDDFDDDDDYKITISDDINYIQNHFELNFEANSITVDNGSQHLYFCDLFDETGNCSTNMENSNSTNSSYDSNIDDFKNENIDDVNELMNYEENYNNLSCINMYKDKAFLELEN